MEQNTMNVINTQLLVLRKLEEKLAKQFSINFQSTFKPAILANQGGPKCLQVSKY